MATALYSFFSISFIYFLSNIKGKYTHEHLREREYNKHYSFAGNTLLKSETGIRVLWKKT